MTTLDANGNNGAQINFEQVQYDTMLGDQLLGHPSVKELCESLNPKPKEEDLKHPDTRIQEIYDNLKKRFDKRK